MNRRADRPTIHIELLDEANPGGRWYWSVLVDGERADEGFTQTIDGAIVAASAALAVAVDLRTDDERQFDADSMDIPA